MPLIGFALSLPSPLRSAVAGGFSPADLSPVLWLDASDATTITESSGSVSQWDDKSGNGNDLTQATSADQPATGTRTLNGLNVLDFDGSSDHMSQVSAFSSSLSSWTVFAVTEADSTAAVAYVFDGRSGGSRSGIGHGSGTTYRLYQGTTVLQAGTSDTSPHILRSVFDTTDTLHVDGASIISGNSGTGSLTGLVLAAQFNEAGAFWNGAIAEVILVENTLTAQQIADTETYLTNKWIPIPIQLNATAWYDASNSYSITESSGSVSQWDDLSGNGYHLTQATGTDQPKTGTATINSLNAIEYDSTSNIQYMENTLVPTHISGPYTVLMVQEINASDTSVAPLGGKKVAYGFAGESGNTTNTTLTGLWGTPSLYVNGTESAVTTRGDVYTAFTNSPALVRQQGILASSSSYNGLRISYDGAGYNLGHGSKVAEVVVLDNPAPADVATAESYLAEKWGVTLQEFSPLDLSPTLWLDASDETTITESGGAVSQWDDKSGNGYNLTQATSSRQPKTGTATMNSLNVIEYDTTSGQQFLTNASVPTTTDFTIFAVYEINALDTAYVGISGESFGEYMYVAADGNTSTTLHQNATATSMYVNNTEFTGTTRNDVYDAVGNSPAIVRITGRFATTGGLAMGYAQAAGVFTFDNGTKVAEMIVVPSPTAQQIYDTENYLANKWGITLS